MMGIKTNVNGRFLRISLRSFIILLTTFCVCFGWYSVRSSEQRSAVQWVKDNGGTVSYDFQFDEAGFVIPKPQPPGPLWLRDLLGIDYLASVESVRFSKSPKSDLATLDLATLSNFKKLKTLSLSHMSLNDLTNLPNNGALESLYILDLSCESLDGIERMPNLTLLSVYAPKLTDLTPVVRLAKLEDLNLSRMHIDNLNPVLELTQLQKLTILGTGVKDFEPLKSMPSLKQLTVNGQNILP